MFLMNFLLKQTKVSQVFKEGNETRSEIINTSYSSRLVVRLFEIVFMCFISFHFTIYQFHVTKQSLEMRQRRIKFCLS